MMQIDEENLAARINQLVKLFSQGDMAVVISEAENIINEFKSATAYNVLALAYKRLGNYDKAKSIYEEILVHAPENTDFLGNLGNIYMDLGFLDKAEKCFLKCLRI